MPHFEVKVLLNSIDLFVAKRAININIKEKYYCHQFGLRWIKQGSVRSVNMHAQILCSKHSLSKRLFRLLCAELYMNVHRTSS